MPTKLSEWPIDVGEPAVAPQAKEEIEIERPAKLVVQHADAFERIPGEQGSWLRDELWSESHERDSPPAASVQPERGTHCVDVLTLPKGQHRAVSYQRGPGGVQRRGRQAIVVAEPCHVPNARWARLQPTVDGRCETGPRIIDEQIDELTHGLVDVAGRCRPHKDDHAVTGAAKGGEVLEQVLRATSEGRNDHTDLTLRLRVRQIEPPSTAAVRAGALHEYSAIAAARYRGWVIQVPLNDLSRIDESVQSLVVADVASIVGGGTFFRGHFTTAFESSLSSRFAGRSATCVANGTDALYLALAALEVGSGDRVATVANAGGYSTNAILRCGARPTFVDVDTRTAQMAPDSLHELLRDNSPIRAVIATHLYGLVGEISTIRQICDEFDVRLVEDCAQSFGATVETAPAGTFGDMATFSFYPTKNLGAYGDAGAVVSSTAELDQRVRSLAQYGWGSRYEVTLTGGANSRIDEIQAAILSRGLELVDDQNQRRRQIALRYSEALPGSRFLISERSERYVAHLAVMVTDDRDADIRSLGAVGVGTGIHYPIADHCQAAWSDLFASVSLPNTEWLQDRIVTLPCFPSMTDSEVDHVVDALAGLGQESSSSTSSM